MESQHVVMESFHMKAQCLHCMEIVALVDRTSHMLNKHETQLWFTCPNRRCERTVSDPELINFHSKVRRHLRGLTYYERTTFARTVEKVFRDHFKNKLVEERQIISPFSQSQSQGEVNNNNNHQSQSQSQGQVSNNNNQCAEPPRVEHPRIEALKGEFAEMAPLKNQRSCDNVDMATSSRSNRSLKRSRAEEEEDDDDDDIEILGDRRVPQMMPRPFVLKEEELVEVQIIDQ
uniref:C2H2-type domain-containing protein n=1 Tax=Steinernema glaseri TaxID=37863 RepID=A0A1I7ZF37_9BILA